MQKAENFLVALLLLAAVFVCYGNTLNAGFVWDDRFLVIENPLVRAPLASFEIFKQDISNTSFHYTIYYRPLQILTYALDYRMWKMNPLGFHFTGIFLHFLNGLLVFFLIKKFIKPVSVAIVTSVLFVVSPIHAGAVSYVSGRADLLVFLFAFLSLNLFAVFRSNKKTKHLVLSSLCVVMALLTKEIAVVIPFLIFTMDMFITIGAGEKWKKKIVPHLINLGIILLYGLLHHLAFSGRYNVVFTFGQALFNLKEYVLMVSEFFVLAIIPIGLHVRRVNVLVDPWISVLVFIAVVSMPMLIARQRKKIFIFSVLFFVIALFPMFFVVGYFKVFAEHWMYIASVGAFIFAAVLICDIYEGKGRIIKGLISLLICAIVGYYSSLTIAQNRFWQDDVSLSNRVLSFSGGDPVALHYKAVAFAETGRGKESIAIIKDHSLKKAVDPKTLYVKGRLELAEGDFVNAKTDFKEAVRMNASYDDGYFGLAFTALAEEDERKALEYLKKTISINPRHSEAMGVLAAVYSKIGEDEEALKISIKAIKINPYDYNALINLGTAYTRTGDAYKGAVQYLEAIKLYPERPKPYYNLAYLFYKNDQIENAKEYLNKALGRDPRYKPAQELLLEIRDL
jgi:protein O-mannosyl-transferase